MNILRLAMVGLIAMLGAAAASAGEVQVKMLNKGAEGMMVFEPSLLKVAPGTTVTFVATDRTHNAQSVLGMLPDGSEPFVGKLNKDVTVTFDAKGVYGVICKPHYAMGMVALIVVGDGGENTEAAGAVKHPGKAKAKFSELLAKASS